MERNFDDPPMVHFFRDSLFRPDLPLHQQISNSSQQLIAYRIANPETEWFTCMFDDVRSLQAALTELQAKCIDPEAKLKVEQQNINVLQVSTENTTRTAASALADAAAASTRSLLMERDLQQLEDELLKKYVILQEFVQSFQRDSSSQQQQFHSAP